MNIIISKTNMYNCKNCGEEVFRFPSDIRGNLIFCSTSCSSTFYNKSKIIIKKCLFCNNEFHPLRGSRGKFCSSKCQWKFRRNQLYAQIENGTYTSLNNTFLRKYLIEKHGEKCMLCGWNKTNPKTLRCPVQIDHKDGNAENNKLDNLQLICPNCHSLTETYGNLNKGNGRKIRRERYLKIS